MNILMDPGFWKMMYVIVLCISVCGYGWSRIYAPRRFTERTGIWTD